MRPSQLFAAVVAMSSVTNALSGAFDNIHAISDAKNVLFGRQDNNNNNNNDNKDASSQAPQSSNKPTPTQSGNNNNNNNNNNNDDKASTTANASGSGKASGSGGKTTAKPNKTYDPRLPAGGISMVTPNALAGDQFYKVGQYVTFAWNYTSLSVTPSAIDILASCSANQATYTIAVNQSAQETKIVWDTKNTPDGQPPFLTEKYTLIIYDAESSVTAAPRAGYLGAFNQFTFGMYTPQPYVPWNEYQCANCVKNGGLSLSEKSALKVMLITSGTTVASLVYFAHNFGLW
ncbi:hypothetical protein HBH70_060320 [Parastagonospora nodorum]|nr:hypothetical protein HBH53_244430 [Parastagonospora nodorum]KAH3973065.1 hypothetical protein HBH52_147200 [Parastagonospora nodorum]KAH4071721.1 hypothetical protein HBH50_067750 [Parastagonospora nodorum]KAH4094605.1 hypothetical protein HBH48_056020 [Parastagonospora nodorum]KAH4202254.1 hypothetical protein HBH42_015870 [Parastagonospora nodorum]